MFLAVAGLLVSLTQPWAAPAGAITGRIVDPAGNPLANVWVIAAPQRSPAARAGRPESGVRQSGGGPGAQTNDRGEFRIDRVPAGYYIVRAIPDLANGQRSRGHGGASLLVTSYYPGTITLAEAQFVAVADGQAIDLVFSLQAVATYAVKGHIVDETGTSMAGASVRLIAQKGQLLTGPAITSEVKTDSTGAFQINGVIPGIYALLAVPPRVVQAATGNGEPGRSSRAGGLSLHGRDRERVLTEWRTGESVEYRDTDGVEAPVAVVDADLSDLHVTVHRP